AEAVPPPRGGDLAVDAVSGSPKPPTPSAGERPPLRLGRFRVAGFLGSGGFGVVYRGVDDELQREVAIKVPHRQRVSSPSAVGMFLAEARILARLDHPGIVPVYDVGRTEDGGCYVVSRFIDGGDLAAHVKATRPALAQAARLVAQVAEAL